MIGRGAYTIQALPILQNTQNIAEDPGHHYIATQEHIRLSKRVLPLHHMEDATRSRDTLKIENLIRVIRRFSC